MAKEPVSYFDMRSAFKALDELEYPTPTYKGRALVEKVNRRRLKTDLLIEDLYDVSSGTDLNQAAEDRAADIAKAKLERIERIVDLDASSEDELLTSYVGKKIMQCPQCMTLFYKKAEDITTAEDDATLANVGQVCQHCGNDSGYTLIGKVEAVQEQAPATEQEMPAEETAEEPVEDVAEEETPAADEQSIESADEQLPTVDEADAVTAQQEEAPVEQGFATHAGQTLTEAVITADALSPQVQRELWDCVCAGYANGRIGYAAYTEDCLNELRNSGYDFDDMAAEEFFYELEELGADICDMDFNSVVLHECGNTKLTEAEQPANAADIQDGADILIQKAPDLDDFTPALVGMQDPKVKAFVQYLRSISAKDMKPGETLVSGDEGSIAIINGASAPRGIKVADLQPTQSQVFMDKSFGTPKAWGPLTSGEGGKGGINFAFASDAKGNDGSSIITYAGKYIIDGHHRWSKMIGVNPTGTISAIDFPAQQGFSWKDCLEAVHLAVMQTGGYKEAPSAKTPAPDTNNLLALKADPKKLANIIVDQGAGAAYEWLTDAANTKLLISKLGLTGAPYEFEGQTVPAEVRAALAELIAQNLNTYMQSAVDGAYARGNMPQSCDGIAGKATQDELQKAALDITGGAAKDAQTAEKPTTESFKLTEDVASPAEAAARIDSFLDSLGESLTEGTQQDEFMTMLTGPVFKAFEQGMEVPKAYKPLVEKLSKQAELQKLINQRLTEARHKVAMLEAAAGVGFKLPSEATMDAIEADLQETKEWAQAELAGSAPVQTEVEADVEVAVDEALTEAKKDKPQQEEVEEVADVVAEEETTQEPTQAADDASDDEVATEGDAQGEQPAEEVDEIDVDELDEVQEPSVNECITKALAQVYDNVESFELTECTVDEDNKLILTGDITFTSGKTRKTTWTFDEVEVDEENGTVAFRGNNEDIGQDSEFVLQGKASKKKFCCESFKYSYKVAGKHLVEGLVKAYR